MNAEIGIDAEGRPYIQLTPANLGERDLMKYLEAWLPMKRPEHSSEWRIIGDRLPGSGKAG